MRILQVTPYYEEAWAYGGIPRVVGVLARALASRGHEVTVCATDARGERSRLSPSTPRREVGGPEVRIFPNLSNRLAYHQQLFLPRGLAGYLAASAHLFEVGHLHGCHHLPGVLAARALGAARVPYLLTPHGTARRFERRVVAKWIFDHTVGREVLPGAAGLVAVSDAEARSLGALVADPSKVRVIANPLDLAALSPAPSGAAFRASLGLGKRQLVLFLGKITPRKGLDTLVRAFARLPPGRAALVVVGNDLGSGARFERQVAALSLGDSVRRVPLLEGSRRLEALAAADVVVYPSTDEVFGLVPLEAMLCGTPVVVSDDSGCGALVQSLGGGLATPPRDEAALAKAIDQVLSKGAVWREAARAAQKEIRRRFAPEEIALQHERLYRELTSSPRSAE